MKIKLGGDLYSSFGGIRVGRFKLGAASLADAKNGWNRLYDAEPAPCHGSSLQPPLLACEFQTAPPPDRKFETPGLSPRRRLTE
jgi:hypothetical protein